MMKLISVLFPTTLAVAPGHAAAAGDGKAAELVNREFRVIAKANNYWRK